MIAERIPWETREPDDVLSRRARLMGGTVGVHVSTGPTGSSPRPVEAVLTRVAAWASRLTRFDSQSELSRLNADPRTEVPIGPTLAAVLDWARAAEGRTGGIVDVGLLDARLAAENPVQPDRSAEATPAGSLASRSWSLDRRPRGALVRRPIGLRFDLDGVGKGWLADRALARLGEFRSAVVDADGDVAIRLGAGATWAFGVADPRSEDHDLAVLVLAPRDDGSGRHDGWFGLATSGTSVHRWVHDDRTSHHLIDPRTGRPATTDVVQATVLARTAREAEVLAKAAVILGSLAGYALLSRLGVDGALLLTERDELVIHPATSRWLA
jgi:thiamine biosynthesis lipoprotein